MKPPPITLSGNVPTVTDLDHEGIAAELEELSAQETIEWMFDQFGQDHYIACSFQKTTSVTVHMASRINPDARFFYLDTDVLFPETYETRDRLAEALGVEFDRFHNLTLAEQAAEYGDELWKRAPDACCGVRKVEPMRRALASVDCWVAGVRRADSSSRAGAPKFTWDKKFGLWKLNPLADWS
ncbi:MAG: phosphoadenosine phosphosulfate reductase family protein, partial [Actinobacteria bacterium]|nr:phosphoadenosine phosphosulfate reductase family protein [Actinomycetota bacterium]